MTNEFKPSIVQSKKVVIAVYILFLAIVIGFACKFMLVQNYKLVGSEKVTLLQSAAGTSTLISFIVSGLIWIWSNYVSIKLKNAGYIWITLFYIIIYAFLFGYYDEIIFKFKKDNGMWNGSFSLAGIFSIVVIILGIFSILINFFIVRYIIKKNQSKKLS